MYKDYIVITLYVFVFVVCVCRRTYGDDNDDEQQPHNVIIYTRTYTGHENAASAS